MERSLINSVSAMGAFQRQLDVISNNIANLDTTGYKKQDLRFADILNDTKNQPSAFGQLPQRLTPPQGLTLGSGVRPSQLDLDLSQGTLKQTNRPLDMAIEGNALFEVGVPTTGANGTTTLKPYWTRDGAFEVSTDRQNPGMETLVTAQGYPVMGSDGNPIQLPAGSHIQVLPDGTLEAGDPQDPQGAMTPVASFKLMKVLHSQLLQKVDGNLYTLPAADSTGAPISPSSVLQQIANGTAAGGGGLGSGLGAGLGGFGGPGGLTGAPPGSGSGLGGGLGGGPGSGAGAGSAGGTATDASIHVRQGYLESSNVDLTKEMTNLIMVERAYELNSRAVSSDDTMASLANNLRG